MCVHSLNKQRDSFMECSLLKRQIFHSSDQPTAKRSSTRKDVSENMDPASAEISAQTESQAHKEFSLQIEAALTCKPGLELDWAAG